MQSVFKTKNHHIEKDKDGYYIFKTNSDLPLCKTQDYLEAKRITIHLEKEIENV